jgi:hypothetical protein
MCISKLNDMYIELINLKFIYLCKHVQKSPPLAFVVENKLLPPPLIDEVVKVTVDISLYML